MSLPSSVTCNEGYCLQNGPNVWAGVQDLLGDVWNYATPLSSIYLYAPVIQPLNLTLKML